MRRSEFLVRGAALAAGLVGGGGALASCKRGGPARASREGKSYRLRMVTTWPKNFPGLGAGANRLARTIEELSGGRIQVRVYAAGELVPPFECFDAVSRGTADLGHGAAYYWKGKSEAAQFFAAVPFGLNAQEMSGWLRYGGAQELWDELYAPFNLKAFACGNTGVQMGGWFRREIASPADWRGLKMRMPGLGGDVIRQLGATVVQLPGGEIFQALQSGAIDATEWVGPYNDLAFGLYKAAKLYYWPGWHEPATAMELLINRELYNGLSKQDQAILRHAAAAAYDDVLSEFTARNNHALVELVQKHGVQLRRFSDDTLRALAKLSDEVVSAIAARDPLSKRIFDSYQSFRKDAIAWARIGEEGYSLARSLTTVEQ